MGRHCLRPAHAGAQVQGRDEHPQRQGRAVRISAVAPPLSRRFSSLRSMAPTRAFSCSNERCCRCCAVAALASESSRASSASRRANGDALGVRRDRRLDDRLSDRSSRLPGGDVSRCAMLLLTPMPPSGANAARSLGTRARLSALVAIWSRSPLLTTARDDLDESPAGCEICPGWVRETGVRGWSARQPSGTRSSLEGK